MIRAAVADEQPHLLPYLGRQGVVADERAFAAVEDDICGLLIDGLLHVEGLQSLFSIFADRIEIALHDVVLVVYWRQSARGFHQHQPIHAVRDVHAHRRCRTVIHVDALMQRLERELRFMPGSGEARGRTAAGTDDAVQIDVVRHLVVRMVLQMKLHRVALPYADEATRHGAAEGPERVAHALRKSPSPPREFRVRRSLWPDDCDESAAARSAGRSAPRGSVDPPAVRSRRPVPSLSDRPQPPTALTHHADRHGAPNSSVDLTVFHGFPTTRACRQLAAATKIGAYTADEKRECRRPERGAPGNHQRVIQSKWRQAEHAYHGRAVSNR